MTISELVKANGWKRYESGYLDESGDRYLDLSGDSGYAWELKFFSDSDNADGIAAAHWIEATAGDTIAELRHVLKMRYYRDVRDYDAARAAGDDMRGGY